MLQPIQPDRYLVTLYEEEGPNRTVVRAIVVPSDRVQPLYRN